MIHRVEHARSFVQRDLSRCPRRRTPFTNYPSVFPTWKHWTAYERDKEESKLIVVGELFLPIGWGMVSIAWYSHSLFLITRAVTLCSITSGAEMNLQDCVDAFCYPEMLEGNNQYQCENCNMKTDSQKKTVIADLPPVRKPLLHPTKHPSDFLFASDSLRLFETLSVR